MAGEISRPSLQCSTTTLNARSSGAGKFKNEGGDRPCTLISSYGPAGLALSLSHSLTHFSLFRPWLNGLSVLPVGAIHPMLVSIHIPYPHFKILLCLSPFQDLLNTRRATAIVPPMLSLLAPLASPQPSLCIGRIGLPNMPWPGIANTLFFPSLCRRYIWLWLQGLLHIHTSYP